MQKSKVSRRKATLWHLVFSYSNVIYAIATGLFMVPLYLKYIPIELYGAWLASGNIVNWLLVVDPGISTVVMQRVGQSSGASDKTGVGEYALVGMIVTCVVALIALLIGLICMFQVANWVNLEDLHYSRTLELNFLLAVISSSLMLFAFAVGAVNLGLQASFAHGMCFLVANTVSLLLTAACLLGGLGLYALTLGMLARAIVFFGAGLGCMLWRFHQDSLHLVFSRHRLREVLRLMSFTSLGRMATMLSKNMDAFILARFLGPSLVPVFVLSRRGFGVAEMVLTRTGNAIGPSLSHLAGEGNSSKIRSIITRLLRLNIWVLGLAFGGFLALNDDFIRLWVGEQFFAGFLISHLLCFLMILSVLVTLMQTLTMAMGDIKRNSVVQFCQALLTFSCLIFGVHYAGMLGAVLAPIVGYVSVSMWYYPRALGRMSSLESSDWRGLAREAVVSIILGLLVFLLIGSVVPPSWSLLITWGVVAICVYGAFLLMLSHLARSEVIQLTKPAIRKIRAFFSG
ncbi:lipopolysaccharide biosynthesis protein [Coraliomargarita sp. W4R53]